MNLLCTEIEDNNLTAQCSVANVSEAAGNYNFSLSKLLDKLAPIKSRYITIRPNTGWYTEEVSRAKHKRRLVEHRWRTSSLEIDRQLYRQVRQHVISLIRKTKRIHYSEIISKCSGDQKQLFRVANKLLDRGPKSPLPKHDSDQSLADRFSQFFTSKISSVRDALPPPVSAVCTPPATILTNFRSLSPAEIRTVIVKSPAKSCDLDPIPTRLLKQCSESIIPAITMIVNQSLKSSVVPSVFKAAHVRPLLKKPTMDPHELQNYRPVSNLPYVSKLLEHCTFSRLLAFLQQNDLLDSRQSAYRQYHSVETLLVHLSNHILSQMDVGRVTALVLLDLSSAFDTIDHVILTSRLHSLGVSGAALQWFESYLADRRQSVNINGAISASASLDCGVPQGSVGGPLLFSIYMLPLSQIIRKYNLQYHCYADDIQLYQSFSPSQSNALSALENLEACVDEIKAWMMTNSLKLNDKKSEFILCGSKQQLAKFSVPSIRIGDANIPPSNKCRNLGVIFDPNMSFISHLSTVSKSVRFHLRNLDFIQRFLNQTSTEQLVHAFITSRLDFCNSLMYNLPQHHIDKLQRLQNASARLIALSRRTAHITPTLKSLHWLPITDRIAFKILLLVFQSLRGTSPGYIDEIITLHQPSRNLRSAKALQLTVPCTTHSWGDRSFSHTAPVLWNNLPFDIRQSSSLSAFKTSLKTHLFTLRYCN